MNKMRHKFDVIVLIVILSIAPLIPFYMKQLWENLDWVSQPGLKLLCFISILFFIPICFFGVMVTYEKTERF